MDDIVEIEWVFFKAMRNGYAPNTKNTSPAELLGIPRSKIITFEHEDFRVVDMWFKPVGRDHSFGNTIVYERNQPVWVMQYWGQYQKCCIPLLKQALSIEYLKVRPAGSRFDVFCGCRGPRCLSQQEAAEDTFTYINIPALGSSFGKFSGHEEIINNDDYSVWGWHDYRGGYLF